MEKHKRYSRLERKVIYEKLLFSYDNKALGYFSKAFCPRLTEMGFLLEGERIGSVFPELLNYYLMEEKSKPLDGQFWWGTTNIESRKKCLRWAINQLQWTEKERKGIYGHILKIYVGCLMPRGLCSMLVNEGFMKPHEEIEKMFPELVQYYISKYGVSPDANRHWWPTNDINARIECLRWAIQKLTPSAVRGIDTLTAMENIKAALSTVNSTHKVYSGGVVPPEQTTEETYQRQRKLPTYKNPPPPPPIAHTKNKSNYAQVGSGAIKNILKAFDISDSMVKKVVITMEMDSAVTFEITRYATYDPDEVTKEIQKYCLVKK